MYIQKKPTMYPPWDSTFDAHINKGRVMQIIVKGKNVDLISETTVELYSLAERCRKNNGKTEIWVNSQARASGICIFHEVIGTIVAEDWYKISVSS